MMLFTTRHNPAQSTIQLRYLRIRGTAILGIDAGSTTTKVALVGEDGSLLYSFYSNNNGNPLQNNDHRDQGYLCPASRKALRSSTPAPPAMAKR